MKRFIIIDDYTEYCLFDGFLSTVLPKLPSKPKGFGNERCPELPEGEWEMQHGMYTMATDGAYQNAGIPKPSFEQLPAIFCVTDDGIVGKYRVKEAEAEAFIKENL